jgi:hypothetical protein
MPDATLLYLYTHGKGREPMQDRKWKQLSGIRGAPGQQKVLLSQVTH